MTAVIIEYVVYGTIFILGLIILIVMRANHKIPQVGNIITDCESIKPMIDELKTRVEDAKFFGEISTKFVGIQSKLGDEVMACVKHIEERRDIAYEEVKSNLSSASNEVDEANIALNKEKSGMHLALAQVKLQAAIDVLKKIEQRDNKKN